MYEGQASREAKGGNIPACQGFVQTGFAPVEVRRETAFETAGRIVL